MNKLYTALLAGAALIALLAPALAFQCPADIAAIDEALQTADLSEEQRQQVVELRDEGERLHGEGDHEASMATLAQAKEILDIE
jgi:hypothetical protein